MAKTPTTTTPEGPPAVPAPPAPPRRQDLVRRRAEEIKKRWKAEEDQRIDDRALAAAATEIAEAARALRAEDLDYWQGYLARYGLVPVGKVWPGCPLPKHANMSQGPADMPYSGAPRPCCAAALTWRLDDKGIHLRSGYWISSPVFQVQRGTNGAPDKYAVRSADGAWSVVDAPFPQPASLGSALFNQTGQLQRITPGPKDWRDTFRLLREAGLELNPEPLMLDGDGNVVGSAANLAFGDRQTGLEQSTAARQLVRFFDQHATEPPVR